MVSDRRGDDAARGGDSRSIPNITAAFLGGADKGDTERDAEVIAKLEEIIDTLRKTGEKENEG